MMQGDLNEGHNLMAETAGTAACGEAMTPLDPDLRDGLIEHLGGFVSENRRQRIERVLERRTRCVTVLLEDVYQPHNASAVLRSCECFGVQDVHVFEGRNSYSPSPEVAMGAAQWFDLIMHGTGDETIASCCDELRAKGYRLVAATPAEDAVTLDDLPVSGNLAIMLGTEEAGLSAAALQCADERVRIPMQGFTESFNVSVCAAVMLHQLTSRMRAARDDYGLSDEEKQNLKLRWYRNSIKKGHLLEARYIRDRGIS
jgi:tRNA (guanosine-2'-O-)-methyltransferase